MEPSSVHGKKKTFTLEALTLIAVLLVVAVIAVLNLRDWNVLTHSANIFLETRKEVAASGDLRLALIDAEAGERGYLLTGDVRYLEPYRAALKKIPGALEILTAGIHEEGIVEQLRALRPLIDQKLTDLREAIDTRSAKGLQPAIAVVMNDRDRATMDEIRSRLTAIDLAQSELLERSLGAALSSRERIRIRNTGGSLVLVIALFLAAFAIHRIAAQRVHLIETISEAEREARQARDWLRTTLASIGDGVIATDGSGTITFLNDIASNLTGCPESEAIGAPLQKVFRIISEETRQPAENSVEKALRDGVVVGLANHTILLSKDGQEIPIDDSAAPIRGADGKTAGVVLVFRSIGERRRMEQVQERNRLALQRSNEELQQFAYAASHDLREPLRTITSHIQLLQRKYKGKLDTGADELIGFTVDGARRMAELIEALLEYARAGESDAMAAAMLDSTAALEAAIRMLRNAIDESGAIVTHDSLPVLAVNRLHLEQVFQNLISNAIKYRRAETPRIHVGAIDRDTEWIFSVRDNGQGIPPQHFDRIFGIFQRLHGREYDGTGIGLATCRKLVERCGGRIWVESQVDEGSTFYFTLPAGLR